MGFAGLLDDITGTVDQELLLQNEYLAAENRLLRAQIKGGLPLPDGKRATPSEIYQELGHRFLREVAATADPDTILASLIANSRIRVRAVRSANAPPTGGYIANGHAIDWGGLARIQRN